MLKFYTTDIWDSPLLFTSDILIDSPTYLRLTFACSTRYHRFPPRLMFRQTTEQLEHKRDKFKNAVLNRFLKINGVQNLLITSFGTALVCNKTLQGSISSGRGERMKSFSKIVLL